MPFRLNTPCVSEIEFNGNTFEIDMSFDNILDVFDLIEQDMNSVAKTNAILALLIGEQATELTTPDGVALVNLIFAELIQDSPVDQVVDYDIKGNPIQPKRTDDSEQESPELYSLTFDASYIFSSFLMAYNMNLHDQFGKLHWEQFKILLRDLPDDTPFSRIVDIRGKDLNKIKDKNEKSHYKKLKKIYKLPNQKISDDYDPRFPDE